jgi:hypothetical protein
LRRRGLRKRRADAARCAAFRACEKTTVPQPKKRAAAKVPVEYDEESEEEARPARSAVATAVAAHNRSIRASRP